MNDDPSPLRPVWRPGIEIGLVILVALWVTRPFLNFDTRRALRATETQYLTSSATFAALSLREYGYLPLWQPWLESGEPLIDNPFSFVLNPFTGGPALILGGTNGVKIGVVLTAILAGIGGWVLGRVAGLGALGRVLLALLVIGKGNMHVMIATGHYQLGTSQAYFPWIAAGTLAIFRRPAARWPVVLAALAFTLLFWAGNIWYTLPMGITVAVLAAAYAWEPAGVDWAGLRRLALAALLALGLSAITLLPVWVQRDHIGHPALAGAGPLADPLRVLAAFVTGDLDGYADRDTPGDVQLYFAYVSPLWYAILALGAGAALDLRHRPRLWLAGGVLAGLFTLWGLGGSVPLDWLYVHVPLLGHWRFPARALAVASFWVAVLVALGTDRLWQAITGWQHPPHRRAIPWAAALLVLASGIAAWDVLAQWGVSGEAVNTYQGYDAVTTERCLDALRERAPHDELAVYRYYYDVITPFLARRIRFYDVGSDYTPLPQASTIGGYDLTRVLPEYGLAFHPDQERWLAERGYQPVSDLTRCDRLVRKPDVFSYAFTVPLATAQAESLLPEDTAPITDLDRRPDRVTLRVEMPSVPTALVVQERAYPGWRVEVDGRAVRLESVGGLVGVILPPGSGRLTIRFAYCPPLVRRGGLLSLFCAGLCAAYLLRVDRRVWRWRQKP